MAQGIWSVWPDGTIRQGPPPQPFSEMGPPRPDDEFLRARRAFGTPEQQATRAAAMEAELTARNSPFSGGQTPQPQQSRGFFSMPEARSGFRSAAPGLAALPGNIARFGGIVARGAGPFVAPAVEAMREGPVVINPESTAGDITAAAGRSTGRLSSSLAAGGLGMATGGPWLGVPAAIGTYLGVDELMRRGVEPASRWIERANPAGFSPEAMALVNDGRGALATSSPQVAKPQTALEQPTQSGTSAQSPIQPNGGFMVPREDAPAPALAPPQRQRLKVEPESGTIRSVSETVRDDPVAFGLVAKQAMSEIGRLEKMAEDYQRQSGQVIPKQLSAMDKWTVLAKALGVGLLVSAFPGLGALAAVGAGLFAGGSELNSRRGALGALAQQEQDQRDSGFKQLLDVSKERRGVLGDWMEQESKVATEAGLNRRADQSNQLAQRRLAIESRNLAAQGFQPIQREDGEVVFYNPATGESRSAGKGTIPAMVRAQGTQPDPLRSRAMLLDAIMKEPGMTAEKAIPLAAAISESDPVADRYTPQ